MFGSPKMPAPPPPPPPPPNPPTFADAMGGPVRRSPVMGFASTLGEEGRTGGLVDQQTPGRKTLLGS